MDLQPTENVAQPPLNLFSDLAEAPVFSVIVLNEGSESNTRHKKQLCDIRCTLELTGARIMQNPWIEPEYNIPIVYFSTSDVANRTELWNLYQRMGECKTTVRDLFHENYIWELNRSQAKPDLNLFKIGPPLFEPYDANDILLKKKKWTDLKQLTFESDSELEEIQPENSHSLPILNLSSSAESSILSLPSPTSNPQNELPRVDRKSAKRLSQDSSKISPSKRAKKISSSAASARVDEELPRASTATSREAAAQNSDSSSTDYEPELPVTNRRVVAYEDQSRLTTNQNQAVPSVDGSSGTPVTVPENGSVTPFSTESDSDDYGSFAHVPRRTNDAASVIRSATSRGGSTRSNAYRLPTYTRSEQQAMLDWVILRGFHDRIMSRELYVEMATAKVSPYGRTWGSLSNNFRKSVLPNLRYFKLTEPDRKRFERRLRR